MDLKQLEAFARVAEFGSFSRAAEVIGIAQPALSRQVRALEVELGQRLFDRNGRGAVATDAGRVLLAHALGILQQVERARLEMRADRDRPASRLSVGLPPSVARTLAAPLAQELLARRPETSFAIVEGLSANSVAWLEEGRIDIAVLYQVPPRPELLQRELAREPLLMVRSRSGTRSPAKRTAPIALAELAALPLILPPRPHSTRLVVESALAHEGLRPKIALEVESVGATLDLIGHTQLVTVLSRRSLPDRDPDGETTHDGAVKTIQAHPIQTHDGPLSSTLSIATSARRPRGAVLDEVEALLVQWLRADGNAGPP